MNKTPIIISFEKLGRQWADGLAYCDDRAIKIDSRLKGYNLFYTLIHEIMHIQNPKWSEIKVEGHSKEMALLLWEQNYRRVDQ